MNKILGPFFLIFVLSTFASCSKRGNDDVITYLNVIESLSKSTPDSACLLIKDLDNRIANGDISLDETTAYEKLKIKYALGLQFIDIDEADKVAEYYSSFGTTNDKLQTRYFLGLYLLDNGDTPRATDQLNKCISMVEDTDDNLDWVLVSKVYSQMSGIYHQKKLPEYELSALKSAIMYAKIAHDSILALRYEEFLVKPYDLWGINDSIISISERCAEKYYEYGLDTLGNIKQENALYGYLVNGDYDKAKKSIEIYEKGSGLFNEEGNIVSGKEVYYYKKGLYYLGTNNTDSASVYFRKLLMFKEDLNNRELAYRGLLLLYKTQNNIDSIGKYAQLYCETNDSVQIIHNSEEISRMQATYNYELHKRRSEQLAYDLEKLRLRTYLYLVVVLIVAILAGQRLWRYKQRRQRDFLYAMKQYNEKMDIIRKLQQDKNTQDMIIAKLTKETESLRTTISNQFEIDEEGFDHRHVQYRLQELHNIAKHPLLAKDSFTDDEWIALLKFEEASDASFMSFISKKELSLMEKKIAVLTRLEFLDNEIMALIDTYGSAFSNCKLRINKKLFGLDTAKQLRFHIMSVK